MSQLTSAEEIAIITAAAKVITDQKAALANAVQSLTPLADENLKLRDVIRSLEAEDAASDAALASLAALLPQPEVEVEPEIPAEPEAPAADPVAEPATETPAE